MEPVTFIAIVKSPSKWGYLFLWLFSSSILIVQCSFIAIKSSLYWFPKLWLLSGAMSALGALLLFGLARRAPTPCVNALLWALRPLRYAAIVLAAVSLGALIVLGLAFIYERA